MKKSLLAISLLLSQQNFADNSGKIIDKGLFWEVSGNGLKKPSYLLGTFHLANYQLLDSMPGVMEKFVYSDLLVTEIKADSNGAIVPDFSSVIMKDTSLHDLLTPVQYEKFAGLVKVWLGMDASQLDNIRPGFIVAYLVEAMMMRINGQQGFVEKMDMGLMNSARKMEKECEGLETMEYQINVLKHLGSLHRQAEQLAEFVSDTTKAKKELSALYNAYRKGNLSQLVKMSKEGGQGMNEEELKQLLNDRNTKWLTLLPGFFNRGSAFVAVGALHLAGPDGLIVQLRKMGYTVTPVKIESESR